jgi:enoyl-CoA hydratase
MFDICPIKQDFVIWKARRTAGEQREGKVMTHSDQLVSITSISPAVRLITITREERRNALNFEIKRLLSEAVLTLDRDATARVIVITGAGKCFVAGTDVAEMKSMSPTDHTVLVTDGMFTTLRRCTKPIIAAVEGYALGGGCELALTCDLIVSGDGARFGLPEIRVGVMPGAGGTQRLLRTIGKYRTMRLVLTGEQVTGREAHAMGMISEVTPDGHALERALELAATIATMPPLAVRAIKEMVQFGGDASLEAALLMERKAFQVLYDSQDQTEGMQAFLEKRPPNFVGR